jgi:hypothetical protein
MIIGKNLEGNCHDIFDVLLLICLEVLSNTTKSLIHDSPCHS